MIAIVVTKRRQLRVNYLGQVFVTHWLGISTAQLDPQTEHTPQTLFIKDPEKQGLWPSDACPAASFESEPPYALQEHGVLIAAQSHGVCLAGLLINRSVLLALILGRYASMMAIHVMRVTAIHHKHGCLSGTLYLLEIRQMTYWNLTSYILTS